jgi:hypothetical protein
MDFCILVYKLHLEKAVKGSKAIVEGGREPG